LKPKSGVSNFLFLVITLHITFVLTANLQSESLSKNESKSSVTKVSDQAVENAPNKEKNMKMHQVFWKIVDVPESFFRNNSNAFSWSWGLNGGLHTMEYDLDEETLDKMLPLPEVSEYFAEFNEKLSYECRFDPRPDNPNIPTALLDWYHRSSGVKMGLNFIIDGDFLINEAEDTYEESSIDAKAGYGLQFEGTWFFGDLVGVSYKFQKTNSLMGQLMFSSSISEGDSEENTEDDDDDENEEEWDFDVKKNSVNKGFLIEYYALKDIKLFIDHNTLSGSGEYELNDYKGISDINLNIDGKEQSFGVESVLFKMWKVGLVYSSKEIEWDFDRGLSDKKLDTTTICISNQFYLSKYMSLIFKSDNSDMVTVKELFSRGISSSISIAWEGLLLHNILLSRIVRLLII